MLCVQARHAALEALVQYPASDILHCQYFVAVKDAMLAALLEPRMQVTAYMQFAAVCACMHGSVTTHQFYSSVFPVSS